MSAHEKLNDDTTGTGQNLDQVLYFDLKNQIQDILKSQAQQFSEYGLTQLDVLEEIKLILPQITVEIAKDQNDNQSSQSQERK